MFKKSELIKNIDYYLMILPAYIVFFIISYLPLPGILIAFKEYNFKDGIFGSPFVGFKNFKFFFKSEYAFRTTFNTLWINSNNILWGTLIAVTLAILLNEISNNFLKKLYQNVLFLPYFLSAVVVGKFVSIVFSDAGLANQLLSSIGIGAMQWYTHPAYWVKILVGINIWKGTGYAIIIYLSVIVGIDQELYEAASMDGATRWHQIRHIMLPLLVPTIIILTLLSIGRVFFGDFQTIYSIVGDNGALFQTTDVIETYVFRAVKTNAEFSMAGAIGLYQSIVGFILIFGSNFLVKLYDKEYSLF